jgi:hypothetical protein
MSGVLNLLLAGAASAIKDAYYNLTTLLLNTSSTNGAQNNTFLDSSSSPLTITRNGNTTQGTFTPFSQTGWSNNFNGSTDYLTTPSNAALAYGSGDFTFEAFSYLTSNASANSRLLGNWSGTWGANFWSLHSNHSSYTGKYAFFVYNYNSGSAMLVSTSDAPLNQWVHIAITRSGNTWRLFINGVLDASQTSSASIDGGSSDDMFIGGTGQAGEYSNGYMSNVRIVKGTAVYTSAFTPPTTPLTAISGTSLLTCQSNRFLDSSTSPLAITLNGTPSVQAFSPFAPTAAYDAAVVGGSGYFDGSGDYLTVPAGSAFAPGTGDFTVDGWIYPTSGSAIQRFYAQSTSGTNYFLCEADVPNKTIRFIGTSSGGGTAIVSAATLQLNAWNNFCISRTSGTVTVWCNGSAGTPTSNTTNFSDTSYTPTISGYSHSTGSEPIIGYLSGLRYVKGTALSGATVPTSPPTAITNTTLLLNYTNSGIFDSTAKNVLETVGNAQVSTTQVKWGTTSMYFDGSGDWLLAPNRSLFDFGSGSFTVEGWFYPTTSSPTSGLITKRANSGVYAPFLIETAASLTPTFYFSTTGSSWNSIASSISFTINTWNHFAITRNGSTFTIWINGSSGGTASTASALMTNTDAVSIGASGVNGDRPVVGYMDDVRITNGLARYTATFTPPTAAFPLQ